MKKSKGIILGVAIDIFLCLPGLIWWAATKRQVHIRPTALKEYITYFLLLVVITAAVMFAVWFNKAYKQKHFGNQKNLNWTLYWALGFIGAFSFALVPALICQLGFNYDVFDSIKYLAVAFGVTALGSIIPYKVFKP